VVSGVEGGGLRADERGVTAPDPIVRAPRLAAPPVTTAPLAGIPVARLDTDGLLRHVAAWLEEERPRRLVQLDAWLLTLAVHSDAVHRCLAGADLVCARSAAIGWIARLMGEPLPERIDPLELLLGVAQAARNHERTLFLLTHEKGLGEIVAHELQRHVSGLPVAGCAHARLELDDVAGWQEAANRVAASGADIVMVVQDGPQQELFVERHLATMGCRVAWGASEAVDLLLGRVRRAPRWLTELGVETVTRPKSRSPRARRHVASCWTRLAARAVLSRAASRRPL
jgi:N-acetylglucosaminyldiphosphoundecaprenol N-acetyl-beta-D-mannosaminyltransferase